MEINISSQANGIQATTIVDMVTHNKTLGNKTLFLEAKYFCKPDKINVSFLLST